MCLSCSSTYLQAEQRYHARRVQMQAIMQSVKQPGAQHTTHQTLALALAL